MAGIITTGSTPKALWPGVKHWWGTFYEAHPEEYTKLFEKETSDKKYEEDVQVVSFGFAPKKTEGQPVRYDSEVQGFINRSTHDAFGLGFIVTKEELDDNLYEKVAKRRTQSLAFSMQTTKEQKGANVYNRAFSTSFTFADGKPMLATDHPTQAGNKSNMLATPADLSEASIEESVIQMRRATDDRGLPIRLQVKNLIIAPENEFEAYRILKSDLQNDTANNAVNSLKAMGVIPEVVVNHFLTDADAWFIRSNMPGLIYYERTSMQFTQDNDFDTENFKAKAYERYSFTCYDTRNAIFGSQGI